MNDLMPDLNRGLHNKGLARLSMGNEGIYMRPGQQRFPELVQPLFYSEGGLIK